MRSIRLLTALAIVAAVGPPAAVAHNQRHEKRPLVIGHRGYAGLLPDHTLPVPPPDQASATESSATFAAPEVAKFTKKAWPGLSSPRPY